MYTEGIKVVTDGTNNNIISRHGITPIMWRLLAAVVNDIIILGDRHNMTDTGNETIVMMRSTILSMAYILLQLHVNHQSLLWI